MIKLGDRMRDKISGFSGIVVGHLEWVYGFSEYGLIPECVKDALPIAVQWFHEWRLEADESENNIGFRAMEE